MTVIRLRNDLFTVGHVRRLLEKVGAGSGGGNRTIRKSDRLQLVSVYDDLAGERVLWRLAVERSREDDPFMPWALRTLPSRAEHKRIVKSKPLHRWLMIKKGRAVLGVVQITKRNEIGIVFFQRYRSMGYGALALALLLQKEKPLPKVAAGRFRARIHPQNFRSSKLFERFGFEHTFNEYELRR